jgi:hypothetical protein
MVNVMHRRRKAQTENRRDGGRVGGSNPPTLLTYASLAQGLYYFTTGLWPLVSIRTFQMVTGPKTDLWLVKTVGVLVTAVGAVLGVAGLRRQAAPETALLAVSSAAGLAGIDIVYVARRRISPIYLLDALGQLVLAGLWAVGWAGSAREGPERS